MRKAILGLSATIVALAVVFLGRSHVPAQAQDTAAPTEQYLASLLLTPGDIPGYRLDSSGPSSVFARQIAGRQATFTGTGSARVPLLIEWVALLPDEQSTRDAVASIRSNVRRSTDNLTIVYTWDSSVAGFEQAERYRWIGRFSDGSGRSGVGIAFRRGPVYFELLAESQSAQGALAAARDEALRLATVQNEKASRIGPFLPLSPADAPQTTPQPQPTPARAADTAQPGNSNTSQEPAQLDLAVLA